MTIFDFLTMLGGLGMFLFGMSVMGEGLERQAGGKMKNILERLASNKVMGVLLGIVVTAIIQSSSATTVMVVGFVNSGIMQLAQAINIIMGANVGTTATAWLMSLTGLEGESFIVQILKPTTFSPVLALIGVGLYMFSKKRKHKDIGTIMLGFAILMFGMDTMSGAVAGLKNVPAFTNLMVAFTNPILGVLVGAVLTAVIQSSSASVGILQALSSTGKITFQAAIPIIMGQNIGTCVTALISSVGTNKNARRTALVHLYFNLIGTTVFLVAYYSLNAVFNFAFPPSINQAGIAIVHTVFNVLATAVLIPFSGLLEKLALLTIKDDAKSRHEENFELLDDRLLATPSVAVSQCTKLTKDMGELTVSSLNDAVSLFYKYDEELAARVEASEKQIDQYEDKLGSFLVKLSGRRLSSEDGQIVSKLLHVIGDFERISDHAASIMKSSREMNEKNIAFSSDAIKEMAVLIHAVEEAMSTAILSFEENDVVLAARVEPLEQVTDNLRNELKARHVLRLQKNQCTIELGFIYSDLIADFERVADHASNIAVCVIQVSKNIFDTHEYLETLKASGEDSYMKLYESYLKKYDLNAI